MSLVRRLLGIVAAGFAVVSGVRILSEPSCESVSFGRAGGRRVSAVTCFSDGSGALPANLAGIGLIVLALIVVALALRRPRLTSDLSGLQGSIPAAPSESLRQPPRGSQHDISGPQVKPETCHACGVPQREGSAYCPACGEKLTS